MSDSPSSCETWNIKCNMWLYVLVQQFFMVIFQKLNKSSVNVSRSLNTCLSKILKIKIISIFTSSATQCNISNYWPQCSHNEMSDDHQMTVMCTGQLTGVQEVVIILLKNCCPDIHLEILRKS